ncbi:MAG: cytochrome c [Miltoncostaeaceae bacterium]|jgi:hypothetical protein|nr:cytochrome c [Miltoncostaeaceae bacterium]
MRARTSTRPARRARRAATIAAMLAVAGPLGGSAAAVEGNLYLRPPTGAAASAPFVDVPAGTAHVIVAPAQHVAEGQKWRAHWACDVPGTELASLGWTARRDNPSSNLASEVRAGGTPVWVAGDLAMSVKPVEVKVPLPPGTCVASLALRQTASAVEGERRYVIANPRAVVRDLAPPVVSDVQGPSGWVGAASADIAWTVTDNLGGDGIAKQHVLLDGAEVWGGYPGEGRQQVPAAIAGLSDGVHQVTVQADGDGTSAGAAAGPELHIDRTPPAVQPQGVIYPEPGHATFGFSNGDALSGVREITIEVNGAADGSPSGPWYPAGSVSGGTSALEDVDLTALVPGSHAWRVRAVDEAGNVQVAEAAMRVLVDSSPPVVELGPLPRGPVSRLALPLTVADNLAPLIGLGPTIVQVNTADEGLRTGTWVPLTTLRLPSGRHVASVQIKGVPDGRHAILVTTHNGGPYGKALYGRAFGEILVDTTPPQLDPPAFTTTRPGQFTVSWIANDPLAGVATAAVQRREGDKWRTLESQPADEGNGSMTVDVSHLPEGMVSVRLAVVDRAGNVAIRTAELDHTGPTIADLKLRDGRVAWRQTDVSGGFGACETAVQVNGPGTENEWREIAAARLGAGPQSVRLPVDGLASGAYRLRVVACDAGGNITIATLSGGVRVGSAPLGAGSAAVDPFDGLADARLTMQASGARVERKRGRDVLVKRVRFGESVTVTGRLREATGGSVRGAEVEARGPGGRVVGRGRTAADGSFRIRVRPDAGGVVRVGVPSGGELFPIRPQTALRVVVTPRIEVRASDLSPAPGESVTFSGRIFPAPSRVGARSKGITLEWVDPGRNIWRPMVNARTRPDGSFSIPWDFKLSGLTIPVRVAVEEEGGWPLLPAVSKQMTVTVG